MFRSAQFTTDKGLGRVALAAFALGAFMALHAAALGYAWLVVRLADADAWSPAALDRWRCVERWCLYALALGVFHMSEFLLTAAFRPSVVSYECTCRRRLVRALVRRRLESPSSA